jgi:hypothetical protein
MNDNDIIKALGCCIHEPMLNCRNCPYESSCNMGRSDMQRDVLALVNRQKAEIDRLNHIRAELSKEIDKLRDMVAQNEGVLPRYEQLIKAEANKEFAEKISKIFERFSHVHNYAEKAKRCTIETDEGTSIELVSVWNVMDLKKHEMVDYETMNELQDNIETISKERLLSELEKDFRLLVKEMTEEQE